jgi:hypothetical protein
MPFFNGRPTRSFLSTSASVDSATKFDSSFGRFYRHFAGAFAKSGAQQGASKLCLVHCFFRMLRRDLLVGGKSLFNPAAGYE